MISVEHLSKRFGGLWALRDVSFDVRAGELLGLIGPNGAGKSTLFRCMAGLLAADGGSLRAGGAELDAARRRETLLFLPDGIAPWRDQRVVWLLDFVADALRAARDWRGELSDVLRLREIQERRLGQLSKGQRKRVLLAAALAAPQPLILMDEPFDGLDLRHAREVAAYLRRRVRDNRSGSLFVSIHSMHEAQRVCDRYLLLNEGRVVAQGTLDELAARATERDLEEIFLRLTA